MQCLRNVVMLRAAVGNGAAKLGLLGVSNTVAQSAARGVGRRLIQTSAFEIWGGKGKATAALIPAASRTGRWALGVSSIQQLRQAVTRRMCSGGKAAKPKAKPEAEIRPDEATFSLMAQADSGFYQGGAVLVGATLASIIATPEQKGTALAAVVTAMRNVMRISYDNMSDKDLLYDHIMVNIEAVQNVILSSPMFYSIYHMIHGSSMQACFLRGITGTVRIVPFMFLFYGFLGTCLPLFTDIVMTNDKNKDYATAKGDAQSALLLSVLVWFEALVELRGCGVTFDQMRPAAFIIFIPALIGRLASGVLLQANKIGGEFENVLPESFRTATEGTTFILLQKGKLASGADLKNYMLKGTTGKAGGGVEQFIRTLGMRFGFCLAWNWCSSQPMDKSAADIALAQLGPSPPPTLTPAAGVPAAGGAK